MVSHMAVFSGLQHFSSHSLSDELLFLDGALELSELSPTVVSFSFSESLLSDISVSKMGILLNGRSIFRCKVLGFAVEPSFCTT